jgi:hypothetical protein
MSPSKSPAQKKLMRAVAHDPAFAAKVGIPVSVGQDFFKADQAKARRGSIGTAMQKAKVAKGHTKARR